MSYKVFKANDVKLATVAVADSFLIIDDNDSNTTRKSTIVSLAAAMSGTGLSASSGSISVDAAQSTITSLGTLTALTVDDLVLDGKVLTMTGSSGDTAVFTAGTNGTLSIVTVDAAGTAANFQITADGTVDIDSVGILTLDSGAAINIEPADGSAILLDGTISIDAGVVTGATSITSTAFVGALTGNVTGNASGTAATVTTAAQTNITSLGTLTALTVDDIALDGKVLTMTGSSSDTVVMTAAANGAFSLVTTDDAAAAANITITADGTAELGGTTVTLNSSTGITLDADNGTITFSDAGSSLGTVTSSGWTGDVVGDVTGNCSGTAATVTTAAQTSITSLGTLTALTVDSVALNGKVMTMTGSTDDTATFTVGTDGTLAITTVDTAAAAANMTLTADGTFEAVGTTITLDSGGAINLEPASGSAILLDGTISIDLGVVTGATSITSTAFVGGLTGDVTGDLSGTAGIATAITASANNSTNETVYPLFVDGATGTQGAETDTGFTYNPSSGNLTIGGELAAVSLDISGSVDVDGTMEADAYTVNGDTLAEYIADTIGAMVGSNTESGITVAYEDGDNTLDFTVATLNQDTTGTADLFTASANNSTDETCYPVFLDGATGSQGAETDTGLTYNPLYGLLTTLGVSTQGFTVSGVVAKTANYTFDASGGPNSVLLCDSKTGTTAFTITLPTAVLGRVLTVKDSGGGAADYNISIASPGSVKIDGSTSNYALNVNYGSVTLTNDGTNWFIV